MQRVVVDAKLFQLLPYITLPIQLVDRAGNAVGVYTPDPARVAELEAELSDEEWARRSAEPGGRTLAEILADLEKWA